MQDEEKNNRIEEEHPSQKSTLRIPTKIWIFGGLTLLCIPAGIVLGSCLDNIFYGFFIFAAIFFFVEVFLVANEIITRKCPRYLPCIFPAVALLLEVTATVFIVIPFVITDLFWVFLFGFLLIVVAESCGIAALSSGIKKSGRLAFALALAAVLIPILALLIVIILMFCGVAIIRFM